MLNSIYSYGIDKELNHINLLNTGTKNLNFNNFSGGKKFAKKDGINIMFDASFKYNYFYSNSNKIRKRSNSKNRNNSPWIFDSKFHSSDYKNTQNTNKESPYHNIKNIKLNDNMKKVYIIIQLWF